MGDVAINCPSCGAPVELRNRFVKLAVCEFCRQTMHIARDVADSTGKTAVLADSGSPLHVGGRGRVRGRDFLIAGRLRYEYDDGFWDEWYLVYDDGGDGWLHEDEGDLTLLDRSAEVNDVPPYFEVRVGGTIPAGGMQVFVIEKGRATVSGGEGQLPVAVRPNEEVSYVDGNAGGRTVMIEYTQDGAEVCSGEDVDPDELVVEEPRW